MQLEQFQDTECIMEKSKAVEYLIILIIRTFMSFNECKKALVKGNKLEKVVLLFDMLLKRKKVEVFIM